MSTFTLTIDTDNAAFGDSDHERRSELALMLRNVAARVERGADAANILDDNGNNVGRFIVNGPSTTPPMVPSGNDEPLRLVLPDGRTLGLWAHHCESCTSVDVW